jgi:hypothetical protein
MADIKYVHDIDVAGQRQYGADMPNIHNRQAVRGDLTPRSSKAATVLGDSSTRTISRMGAMWWKDVIWHSSGHQHYHWLFLARVPLRYRVQLPWGHLSGLGRNVTAVTLYYKRLQQALELSRPHKATEKNPTLEQYDPHSPVDVGYYAPTVQIT